MRAALALTASLMAAPALAETMVLPSGAEAIALPLIWDESIDSLRLRFILPDLQGEEPPYGHDLENLLADMIHACETTLAGLIAAGKDPRDDGWTGAVVTFMDREVPFGQMDMTAVQLFDAFTLSETGCEEELDLPYE